MSKGDLSKPNLGFPTLRERGVHVEKVIVARWIVVDAADVRRSTWYQSPEQADHFIDRLDLDHRGPGHEPGDRCWCARSAALANEDKENDDLHP